MESEKVKEIKEALKCCSEGKCEKCLIGKKDIRKCVDILLKDTLTLINELESENEKYLDSIESVQAGRCRLRCPLTEQAVKEFAEKLRKKVISLNVWEFGEIDIIDVDDIDELLKEYIDER